MRPPAPDEVEVAHRECSSGAIGVDHVTARLGSGIAFNGSEPASIIGDLHGPAGAVLVTDVTSPRRDRLRQFLTWPNNHAR